MHTEGHLSPATIEDIHDHYQNLETPATVVVREIARAMDMDSDEYDRRVTPEVIETAQDTLFASMLAVQVGTREEFERFCEDHGGDIMQTGSEHVDNVIWHAPDFADTIVATTFQDAPEAAASTLRRQAFGRLYREHLGNPTVEG